MNRLLRLTASVRRRLAVSAVAFLAAAGLAMAPAHADTSAVARIAGNDRVGTAVAVADAGWDTAPHVLLATATNYPDAVAAAALSVATDAPILLTDPDVLSPQVSDLLVRLQTERVTLLGGPGAVSPAVAEALRSGGFTVDRIAGEDRYATAATIAQDAVGDQATPVVALALGDRADGRDAWPDALSAASLAGASAPVPTLLTRRGQLPDATVAALDALRPQRVLVLGGPSAIDDGVIGQLQAFGFEVTRFEGADRYDTSVRVDEAVLQGDSTGTTGKQEDAADAPSQAVFASGEDFVDALSAGALAARRAAPLLLVPDGILADSVDAFLRADSTTISTGTLVGGPATVGDHVESELEAALTGQPRPAPPPPPEPACPPNSSPDCQYTYEHPIETWDRLAQCESGGNWAINTGNGYYGGVQFALASWRSVGGAGYPHQASKWEQIYRAELLHDRQGWGAWPACSRKLGLR